jgi:hypothetical protein
MGLPSELTISETKTKIMITKFPPRIHRDITVKVNNKKLEIVKEFKYLGILIDSKLTFQKHVNYCCGKASTILLALMARPHQMGHTGYEINLLNIQVLYYPDHNLWQRNLVS